MKHFLNAEMLAVNAKAIPVDTAIVQEFAEPERFPGRLISLQPSRNRWKSDIEWISADDEEAFRVFESAFYRLAIPEHVMPYIDIEREVRLYLGSLVVRSRCQDTYFHTDWKKLDNEAFTVITPVTDNAREFGLLYRKANTKIGEYAYRSGEAILFGDNFSHSTKPGRSERPVMLLCFQFGSDKMEYWPGIYEQLHTQGTQLRLPDGTFTRTGKKAHHVVNGKPRKRLFAK
jgi:hypothetical protein